MQELPIICEHRWRYFVNLASRAIRVRVCEICGHRRELPAASAAVAAEAAG
jgi:hypothetical protein